MAKTGRPSKYSEAIALEICERIAFGESLKKICLDPHFPHERSVMRWLFKGEYEAFRLQYARARENQMERMAAEILEIADDGTNDTIQVDIGGVIVEKINHDHINRSRLRVDTRKWLMSKLAAKKYGDKITQEVTGKDGSGIVVNVNITEKTKK